MFTNTCDISLEIREVYRKGAPYRKVVPNCHMWSGRGLEERTGNCRGSGRAGTRPSRSQRGRWPRPYRTTSPHCNRPTLPHFLSQPWVLKLKVLFVARSDIPRRPPPRGRRCPSFRRQTLPTDVTRDGNCKDG